MDWIKDTFKALLPKPKGWVTINDIVKHTGNSRKTVQDRVKKMVSEGQLEAMDCIENNHRAKCYRKKGNK